MVGEVGWTVQTMESQSEDGWDCGKKRGGGGKLCTIAPCLSHPLCHSHVHYPDVGRQQNGTTLHHSSHTQTHPHTRRGRTVQKLHYWHLTGEKNTAVKITGLRKWEVIKKTEEWTAKVQNSCDGGKNGKWSKERCEPSSGGGTMRKEKKRNLSHNINRGP